MPWCPICRNEYKEGYTHCNDCNQDLVPTFEDLPKAIMFGSESDMKEMQAMLSEKNITGTFLIYSDKDACYELYVQKQDVDTAKEYLTAYMQEQMEMGVGANFDEDDDEIQLALESDEMDPDVLSEIVGQQVRRAMEQDVYVDKKAKSAEYQSSGYALLGVGLAGIAVIVLHALGIIKIPLNQSSIIMTYVVMGALFILFIVSGILALKSSKRLMLEDEDDQKLMADAKLFLEAFTAAKIDAEMDFDDATEQEMKYYKRIAYINRVLSEQFPDAANSLLGKLSEDHYDTVFGED